VELAEEMDCYHQRNFKATNDRFAILLVHSNHFTVGDRSMSRIFLR